MHSLLARIRKEPALITGLVSAAIALGVAFGLELTGEQTGAMMAVVVAVRAFATLAQVTPHTARHARDENVRA